MNLKEITEQTMQRAREITKTVLAGEIQKAITTTTGASGITGYILEAPAQQLVPLLSTFRQTIPRKSQPGATAVNWKVITSININAKFSTQENFSANGFTYSTSDKTAAFRVIGRLGSVTREAIAAGQNFDDVKAREVTNTLLESMKEEEVAITGANRTALGTPAAPTATVRSGLGSLAAAAGGLSVKIVALTQFGATRIGMDRPAPYNGTDAFLAGNGHGGVVLDPAGDGVSNASTGTVSAAVSLNDALKITWTAIANAFAYAVFISATAGSEKLEAVVTQTSVTILSLAGTGVLVTAGRVGGATLAAGDDSGDSLIFDGIVPLTNADANAYKKNLGGKFTVSSSTGEVQEIQDMFQYLWDTWKVDDYRILLGGVEARNITKGMIASGGGPTIFVNPGGGAQRTEVVQGYHVTEIVNAVTGKVCPLEVLPWLPGGTLIAVPTRIPFPMAGIEQPFEIAASYGWEQIDYAMTPNLAAVGGQSASAGTGPVSLFEVRAFEVLKAYFPGGCGVIYNIFNG